MVKLTQQILKEKLSYNTIDGNFIWKKQDIEYFKDCKRPKNLCSIWNVKFANKIAGSIDDKGYISINIDYKRYRAHRLAWLYVEGYWPEYEIDHINMVKTDNRWCNLRHVSHYCNTKNVHKKSNNKSGVVGVHYDKNFNKWRAQITINNEFKYLGSYVDFDDAVMERWKAESFYNFESCTSYSTAYNYLKDKNMI